MQFKIAETRTYWWPVTIKLPDPEKSGRIVTESFDMQFEAIPRDEALEISEKIDALPPEERPAHQHDLLLRVCKNWRNVFDGKDEVRFSEENLRLMLQFSWHRIGIYEALNNSAIGEVARRGN